MSLDAALLIARSGLAAVQRGLAQAAQNVANAETAGYARKTIPQQAVTVGDSPAGLRTADAARAVDAALLARLDASRAAAAAAGLREMLLTGIEQAHGDSGQTLADGLAVLRTGFLALRAAPADAGKQQAAAAAAETLAGRLNGLSQAIGSARQQAQDAMVAEVRTANVALRQVAALTLKLRNGADGGAAALEDQRDAAIATLSESLGVQAVKRAGGDLLLVAKGGIVLPLDPDHDLLATAEATVQPASQTGAGGTLPGVTLNGLDITGQLSGGRLGEAIALRDRTLPRYQAEADVLATNLAARLDGEGLRLFTDADGTSLPDPSLPYAGGVQIGFAGRIKVNPAIAANPALLRDGTQAVAGSPTGPGAFTPNPDGGPAGFTTLLDRVLEFGFGAEASAGHPWPGIATAGLGPDGSLASPFTAPATLEAYAGRVTTAQTGDRAAATAAKDQATALGTALQSRFGQQSGVDTDTEMAGIVALQNAYAANAKVLGTVQALFDTLLGAVR
ncbi:MAG: FlgK family flagellar hook-associated protein [Paracraurococcus sp.]